MIKKALTVLLLALACIKGYSQSEFTPEWNFGVNFGPTFSTMSFVTTAPGFELNTKMLQQYKGGVSVRYITENRLGFIAELNYSQQGYEQKFEGETNSKYIHELAYLQIPFLTHIYFGRKGRVFVNLGPQISFLLADRKIKHLLNTDYNDDKVSAQYDLEVQNKFDYGLVAGMGFELRTGAGNFTIEGRYYMGFSDIYKSHKTDPFSRSANRVMSAAITYYMKPF
ncbi:porin family protein [Dysgonomonas sp. GY617]|uniref:porin family protein n=1 Tax=Dysgonomonas sp. GY617 TaxID=2780420 RepID=UPI001883985B|nr:porin family protein [Dysgonomonas sp. GY617]MBF0577626.1 PorT family protein [Dysgonomonas sp. GY617]